MSIEWDIAHLHTPMTCHMWNILNIAEVYRYCYIPLIILLFMIIVFRVSVTAGPMVGYVIISQTLSTPRLIR